jgi:hypothetical protein
VRAITTVNVSKLVKDQRFSAFSSLNESVPRALGSQANKLEKKSTSSQLSDINKFIDPERRFALQRITPMEV